MKKKYADKIQDVADGVIYKPCKFCGSPDYDQADGDVVDCYEGSVFEPDACDQCKFGKGAPLMATLH